MGLSKMYKCIFTDLDKTLLAEGSVLTDYTKETIKMLISLGIDLVPSSGRAFNSLPKDLFSIDGLKYAVTSNGVAVNDIKTGKPLSTRCIPAEELKQIIDLITSKKVCTEIFIEGQGYCRRDYWENPKIAGEKVAERTDYVQSTRKPINNYEDFILANLANADAFDIICNPELVLEMEAELKEKFPGVYITHSEPYLLEISNKDSGKHKGMERCCKLLNINTQDCIAFGDASNDMEMLQEAGLGIAVANAASECKKAADYVSDYTNNQDAVAKELRKIFNLPETL